MTCTLSFFVCAMKLLCTLHFIDSVTGFPTYPCQSSSTWSNVDASTCPVLVFHPFLHHLPDQSIIPLNTYPESDTATMRSPRRPSAAALAVPLSVTPTNALTLMQRHVHHKISRHALPQPNRHTLPASSPLHAVGRPPPILHTPGGLVSEGAVACGSPTFPSFFFGRSTVAPNPASCHGP